MTGFLQAIVNGLATGAIYAVLALSIVLIFKTMGAVNFASGSMGSLAAFLVYVLGTKAGLHWIIASVLALLGAAALGAAVERGIVRPLGTSGSDEALFRLVLATMGLDILLNNGYQKVFGADTHNVPVPLPTKGLNAGGIHFDEGRLIIIGVVLVVTVVLTVLLRRTNLGIALRAYAQDPTAAILMGIPAKLVSSSTWIIAGLLGGIAAILVASVTVVSPGYLQPSFLQAITAAVLGGLASLPGAVVGGFVLGILEALSISYAPKAVTTVLPLALVIIILMVRPVGLFGRTSAQRI